VKVKEYRAKGLEEGSNPVVPIETPSIATFTEVLPS
jgi:hypothetical protein